MKATVYRYYIRWIGEITLKEAMNRIAFNVMESGLHEWLNHSFDQLDPKSKYVINGSKATNHNAIGEAGTRKQIGKRSKILNKHEYVQRSKQP